jgi:hypothetical protein
MPVKLSISSRTDVLASTLQDFLTANRTNASRG